MQIVCPKTQFITLASIENYTPTEKRIVQAKTIRKTLSYTSDYVL